MGRVLYEGGWRTSLMRPATLLAGSKRGLSIIPSSPNSDNLQYSRGSLINGVNYEQFDPNQATIECWIRPNWSGNNGIRRAIINNNTVWGSAVNTFAINKAADDNIYIVYTGSDSTQRYIRQAASSLTTGKWCHIVAVWSTKNFVSGSYYLELYVNGSNSGNTYSNATAISAFSSLPNSLYIGQTGDNQNILNGTLWLRILNRPLTATEVTALYNSAAGSLDSFVVTPDTVFMGNYSDQDTTASAWHRGKFVSAITDGVNDDTLTTSAGSDVAFADGDRVIVLDGTGYSSHDIGGAFVDGTPSSTSIAVDDGAGADAGAIEKIGVNATLNGSSQYFYCADEAGLSLTGDFTIEAWAKTSSATSQSIANKYHYGANERSYNFYITVTTGILSLSISDDGTGAETKSSAEAVNDGKWHHVACVYDAAADTVNFYIDGHADSGGTKTYTVETGALDDNASNFCIGAIGQDNGYYFNGSIARVAVFDDKRSAAEILASAMDRYIDLTGEGNIIAQWDFDGASADATIDNAEGTAARDLTPYNGGNTTFGNCGRSQSAFISKNLIHDQGFENGGIGGYEADASWTLSKSTSVVKYGTQSLKLVNAAGDDGDAFTLASPFLINGEDRYYRLWLRQDAMHEDSIANLVIAGSGTILTREVGRALGDNGEFSRSFDLDGTYYAQAAASGVHDITTQDIGISAWLKVDTDAVGYGLILAKYGGTTTGYYTGINDSGQLVIYIDDGTDRYVIAGLSGIKDNKWHHVCYVIDRSNAANCKLYIDSIDNTGTKTGVLANVDSLSNPNIMKFGANPANAFKFDGQIREVVLAYPADIMAAGEMGASGFIAAMYNNPGKLSVYPAFEDRWACDDNAASTTIVGAVNNLTANANTNVFARQDWKMFEGTYEADQNGVHTIKLETTGAGAGTNSGTFELDDPQDLPNLLSDGGLEDWASATNLTDWSESLAGTSTVNQESSIVRTGIYSCRLDIDASNSYAFIAQSIPIVDGGYYTISFMAKSNIASKTMYIRYYLNGGATEYSYFTLTTNWARYSVTKKAVGSASRAFDFSRSSAASSSIYIDDISIVRVDARISASTATKGTGIVPIGNPIIGDETF